MNTSLPQDQSQFNQAQETFGTPPELEKTPEQSPEIKATRKKMVFIGMLIALPILVLMIYLPVLQDTGQPATQNDEVYPTPTKQPESTKLQIELQRLDMVVTNADPELPPLAPPPIDMDLEF